MHTYIIARKFHINNEKELENLKEISMTQHDSKELTNPIAQ
jgi:hypothetical protein